jgi:RNA polymerase-binding transcription factor DksA
MPYSKEQLAKWKTLLEKERDEMTNRISELKKPSDFGDDIDGLDEEADETEEFVREKGLEETFDNKLQRILHALESIENGSYGICSQCGKEIEPEIFDISPESQSCKECKKG